MADPIEGMFRVEGELGYKRAKNKDVTVNNAFVTAINTGAGTTYTTTTNFNLSGSTSVYSAMLNGLVDLGGNGGMNAPSKLLDPRMNSRHIGFAEPDDGQCECFDMRHECRKKISDLSAIWMRWKRRSGRRCGPGP